MPDVTLAPPLLIMAEDPPTTPAPAPLPIIFLPAEDVVVIVVAVVGESRFVFVVFAFEVIIIMGMMSGDDDDDTDDGGGAMPLDDLSWPPLFPPPYRPIASLPPSPPTSLLGFYIIYLFVPYLSLRSLSLRLLSLIVAGSDTKVQNFFLFGIDLKSGR